jgi:hypothetical protein
LKLEPRKGRIIYFALIFPYLNSCAKCQVSMPWYRSFERLLFLVEQAHWFYEVGSIPLPRWLPLPGGSSHALHGWLAACVIPTSAPLFPRAYTKEA